MQTQQDKQTRKIKIYGLFAALVCIVIGYSVYAKSQKVEIADFIPLIAEIKILETQKLQSQTKDSNPQDSEDSKPTLPFAQPPQLQLIELAKQYQKEHFSFLAKLENLARTEEQKAFVEEYAKFLRMVFLKSLLDFYSQNENLIAHILSQKNHADSRLWAALPSYIQEDLQKKLQDPRFAAQREQFMREASLREQHLLEFWSRFFEEHKNFVQSFGDDFFVYLENYEPKEVCMDEACGHPTEVFILDDIFRQHQTPANKENLEQIANYAHRGYNYYLALKSTLKDYDITTGMGLKTLFQTYAISKEDRLKILETLQSEFEYNPSGQAKAYFESLINFWAFNYLDRLYSGKYAIALESSLQERIPPQEAANAQSETNHTQSPATHDSSPQDSTEANDTQEYKPTPQEILESALRHEHNLCAQPRLLSQKGIDFCESLLSTIAIMLPDKTSNKPRFVLNDMQHCLSLHYEQKGDTLSLITQPNPRNTSPLCQALQKRTKEIATQENYTLNHIPSEEILNTEQQNTLKFIESPHFIEYFALFMEGELSADSARTQELCKSNNPLACATIAHVKKDNIKDNAIILQDSCKLGLIRACDTLIHGFLSKDGVLSPQEFFAISKANCEFGSYGSCSLVGKMLLHAKDFDFEGIAYDKNKGLMYVVWGCQKGRGFGCDDVLAHIDEIHALGLLPPNIESLGQESSTQAFKKYACNKLGFALKECAGEEAEAIFEAQALFMQKAQIARYENGTIMKSQTTDEEDFVQEDITFLENTCENVGNIACDSLMRAYRYFYIDDKEAYHQKLTWAAEIGCRRDDARSCVTLANLSKGVDSLKLHRKACDIMPAQMDYDNPFAHTYTNYESCEIVGDSYSLGLYAPRDSNIAKVYYYKTCFNGTLSSCQKLSKLLQKGL